MTKVTPAPLELLVLTKLHNPTEAEVFQFLDKYVPEYKKWGMDERSKPISKFIEDLIEEKDTAISLVSIFGVTYPLREIQTVTLRITRPSPATSPENKPSKKILREYQLVNGRRKYRKHRNSVSEKLTLEEWSEDHVLAVVRALKQELQINVDGQYLLPPYLFPVPPEYRESIPLTEFSFPELGFEKDERYPGFQKWNQLHHFIWEMPDVYYQEQYHEPDKGYFEWAEGYVDE